MSRQRSQHRPTEHPVLNVPAFGPGIGKEDQDARQPHTRGKAVQELPRFRSDKPEIRQACVTLFPQRTGDPVPLSIDSETELVRVGPCVGGQKMSVPTPKLESDYRVNLHQPL